MNKGTRYQGICEQCGAPTYAHYKSQLPRFCSFSCSNQWKWDNIRQKAEYVNLVCCYCGKEFQIISCDSRIKRGQKRFYCCKECSDKDKKVYSDKKCPVCGKIYNKHGATCSRRCGATRLRISRYNESNGTDFTTIDECKRHKEHKNQLLKEERDSALKESIRKRNQERKAKQRENPEYKAKMKMYLKIYTQTHKEERNSKQRTRLLCDPLFRFKTQTRKLLSNSFRRKKFNKCVKTEQMLGCSLSFFAEYMQSKFKDGMSFENYGEWQIDHIIPLATAKTIEDVIKLNHYSNLQPLWAQENRAKSDKIL